MRTLRTLRFILLSCFVEMMRSIAGFKAPHCVAKNSITLHFKSYVKIALGIMKARVPVRKCIWLCFGYVIEFLMLIWEMAFAFHKSKLVYTRVPLKKLSKKINCMDVSFCFNEQFCSSLMKQKSCMDNDNGHESANL